MLLPRKRGNSSEGTHAEAEEANSGLETGRCHKKDLLEDEGEEEEHAEGGRVAGPGGRPLFWALYRRRRSA